MNPALLQLRLKHLQLLDLIHSTGSLRRAAGALYLTQPAVTAMLKELEHAFGSQLVARDSQGAALTAAGLALRVRLNALLDELRIASGEAGSEAPMRLRVGAMTAMMFDLIPRTITRLFEGPRKIEVRISGGSIEQVIDTLLHNEVDCVVGRLEGLDLDAETRASLVEESLLPIPLGIACSPKHPLTGKAGLVEPAELVANDWVLMPAGSSARHSLMVALGSRGHHTLRPAVESESLVANFHIVANSSLLTVAPRSSIALYRDMGVVSELSVGFPLAISPVAFLCHRVKSSQPAVKLFREAVVGVANEMLDAQAAELRFQSRASLQASPPASSPAR